MIVDGLKFNKCHTVIALPVRDADGNLMPYVQADKENYVHFGQIVEVPDGTEPAAHLVDTGATRTDGSKVFAKVIPVKGYGLTNMMYAKGAYNGYAYLAKDGKYFRAKIKKAEATDVAPVVASADANETGEPVAEVVTDQAGTAVLVDQGDTVVAVPVSSDAPTEQAEETVDLSNIGG